MSARLDGTLTDYLALRRAMGFKLDRAEKLLAQFLAYLDEHDADTVTVENALSWAMLPGDADPRWWGVRLSAVRPFAVYLQARDDDTAVPPRGLIPARPCRRTPYLYSDSDVADLIRAAETLRRPLTASTYRILIGLLAVSGMRVGEAIRLDRDDFDADREGLLTIRDTKFGKTRQIPLDPSTVTALRTYLQTRDALCTHAAGPALLISTTGTRLRYNVVWRTVHRLITETGLMARTPNCRPTIHDLRHSFAVRTLLRWYTNGADVPSLLPHLSTYLGHTDPKNTYWYLSAAPELMALAGRLLDDRSEVQP